MLLKHGKFLLYANRHQSIFGTAGNMLTPANQLLVMGQIIWSMTNQGFKPATSQSLV
jgi:hypothetical protein